MTRPIPDKLIRNLGRAPLVDLERITGRPAIRATVTPLLAETLTLVALGLTNPQIARFLGISLEAARDRVGRLLRLYDAKTRTQLTANAIRRGDIDVVRREK